MTINFLQFFNYFYLSRFSVLIVENLYNKNARAKLCFYFKGD